MSDLLAAAAAALGAPEHLVERAAQARADADGTSYEAVLAAWGGGVSLPAPVAATPPETPPEPPPPAAAPSAPAAAPASAPAAVPAAATLVAAVPAAASGPLPRALSKATPRLEGLRLHALRTGFMLAGLFAIGLVITLIGPFNTGGDFRHVVPDAPMSGLGEQGRAVYLNQGCGYCHTQLVRPVLADVGLGPVTESWADSLEGATFGTQRIGPDLAHVGSRTSYANGDDPVTADEFVTLLSAPEDVFPDGNHPSYAHLSDGDLSALATYLSEMK